jgi:hypothetical protein
MWWGVGVLEGHSHCNEPKGFHVKFYKELLYKPPVKPPGGFFYWQEAKCMKTLKGDVIVHVIKPRLAGFCLRCWS